MGQLDIDALSRLINEPNEFSEFLAHGINVDHFLDPPVKTAVTWVLDTFRTTGKVPDRATVASYTGFNAGTAPEPLKFYCIELIRRTAYNALRDGSNDGQDLLRQGKVEDALAAIEKSARDARTKLAYQSKVYSIEDVQRRIDRYAAAKARTGIMGIPLPWDEFSTLTHGFIPGQFILVAARTGIGKTFFLLMLGYTAWSHGFRVLVVSMEMSPEELEIRRDAYAAEVPLDAVLNGTLSPSQEIDYNDTMAFFELHEGFDIVGHDMAGDMGQIRASVERFQPDLLLIDSMYLCRPEKLNFRMSGNEMREQLAKELTMLGHDYGIPVGGSLQLNRDQKKGSKDGDISNIYGSDTYAQNADLVFTLVQTKEDRKEDSMRVCLPKSRISRPAAARIGWDLDSMEFPMIEFEAGVTSLTTSKPPPMVGASTWRR